MAISKTANMPVDTLVYELNMKPLPLQIICYHCQQSAKKYLKGYIVLNCGEILRTNDLMMNLNKLVEFCTSLF